MFGLTLVKLILRERPFYTELKEHSHSFFYLPGLPILVNPEGFSPGELNKLKGASQLITTSGWLQFRPESIGSVSAILSVPSEKRSEVAGEVFVPLENLIFLSVGDYPIEEVAATMIHEGQHLAIRRNSVYERIRRFESERDVSPVSHSWLSEEREPSTLLEELETHATGIRFLLYLWDNSNFEPRRSLRSIWGLLNERKLAYQAIAILEKVDLGVDGLSRLKELKVLWNKLSFPIRARVHEALNTLFSSNEPGLRRVGYRLAAFAWKEDSRKRRIYAKRLTKAINREIDSGLLKWLFSSQEIPTPVMKVAGSRLGTIYLWELIRGKQPPPTGQGGLEEKQVTEKLILLAEAAQGGPLVLVIEAAVVSRRVGLEGFVARIPRGMGKVVITGAGSAAAKELAARNGNVLLVDSDDPLDLAVTLVGLEEADRIRSIGAPDTANALMQFLPHSMAVTVIDPTAGLEEILLGLGIPKKVLDQVDTAGFEEQLARLHAA